MILAVTGHRPNKLGNEYDGIGPYSDFLRAKFVEIIQEKSATKAISGMALGVDMLWAEVALSLGIPMHAYVPFEGQESVWPKKSQQRYSRILEKAAQKTTVCEGGYAGWKMQVRNEAMVNAADLLVAVWDGSDGGTANCVNYAKKAKRTIVYINPNEWRNE